MTETSYYEEGVKLIKSGIAAKDISAIEAGIEQLKNAAIGDHPKAQKCLQQLKAKANPRHASILAFTGNPAEISFKPWELENLLTAESESN